MVIASLTLRQTGHELAAVLRDEESCQLDDLEILGADVGHAGREVERRGLGRASRFLFGSSRGFAGAAGSDSSAPSLFDLAEAPEIERVVGVGIAEEAELGVILLLVADAVCKMRRSAKTREKEERGRV